jgi:hypothetical protein
MVIHKTKKEIERKERILESEKPDVLDEAERLYAASTEAALQEFRLDRQEPWEGEW